jgi:hypothetical protein
VTARAKVKNAIEAVTDNAYTTNTAATATAVSLEIRNAQATATASIVEAEKRNKLMLQQSHQ